MGEEPLIGEMPRSSSAAKPLVVNEAYFCPHCANVWFYLAMGFQTWVAGHVRCPDCGPGLILSFLHAIDPASAPLQILAREVDRLITLTECGKHYTPMP